MRISLVPILALSLMLTVVGCGDRPDVDFGGRDLGPDLFSIVSTDGAVRMTLTDDFLYIALAEETAEQVREDLRSGSEREGAAAAIGGFVERTVGKALQFRSLFPLDEIEDIWWSDGEMQIEFTGSRHRIDEMFRVDDQPVTRAFDEAAVQELSEEFHALKRERAARGL
jgi:hypothetical protein